MSKLEELRGKIDAREARIGVIGLGYVGLPLAVELGNAGFSVIGFDVDVTKVRTISEGRSYIGDVESCKVAKLLEQGRLEATGDFDKLATVDVINICVPTPLRKTRDPDVSFIASAMKEIRKHLHEGQLIILGSTTYPGTTHEFVIPLLAGAGLEIGKDYALAFAPERIDQRGDVVDDVGVGTEKRILVDSVPVQRFRLDVADAGEIAANLGPGVAV